MERPNSVLVTGGTGFIGRHLVRRLLAAGRTVFVTGFGESPSGTVKLANEFQRVSSRDVDGLGAVFHLAAETDTRAPDETQWQVNCEAAADFLLMCRESYVVKLVYASSCAVYGSLPPPYSEDRINEPVSAYGAAKSSLDRLVKSWAVGLRPSNVFGPGEEHKGRAASVVSQIVAAVRDGKPVKLWPCVRDLVAVDDVAEAFVQAEKLPNGTYNVGGGESVNYFAVAVKVGLLLGRTVHLEKIDCPFPAEFQQFTAVSTAKLAAALAALGGAWKPKPWRAALAEYVAAGWPKNSAI